MNAADFSTFESMLTFANGRKRLIELSTVKHEDNWQDVATPYDICGEMVDLVVGDSVYYVVMYSLEFLEVMIHERGVSADSILFVTDYEVEGDLALAIYGIKSVICNKNMVMGSGKFDFTIAKDLISVMIASNMNGENGMKFNKVAVVGNPPYQVQSEAQQSREGGKSQAKPIYHLFVEAIIDNIAPDYLTMIIPSRWMVGGMGLDKHRERMMNDTRMKKIVDDMSCNGIFPTVDIAGGVNYFLWQKDYDGKCEFNGVERSLSEYDIIIRENEARSILSKVKAANYSNIGNKVSSCKPYGIGTKTVPSANGVPCWFKQSVGKSFVDMETVKDNRGDINKWKVLAPRSPIAGQTDFTKPVGFFTVNNIVIAAPSEICTETYLVINSFTTKKEAENFITYMRTKFFRFMLRLRVISQDVTRECYNWVPDVEDYSMPWTDAELYKKFNLSRQEIAYIESKIKDIATQKCKSFTIN